MGDWIKQGNKYMPSDGDVESPMLLPAQNYVLLVDGYGRLYLEVTGEMFMPPKLYGDVEQRGSFYINRHRELNRNTGILLVGAKGMGKSLVAKYVCINAGLPVIILSQAYTSADFKQFILGRIKQPCIIFIDEYDKIYEDSNALLSLMDGVASTNILWILTSNKDNISYYMKNRPSRIRYTREYSKLSDDIVKSVLDDKLEDKSQEESFLRANFVYNFNMDTLIELITEVNQTKMTLQEVFAFGFNISIDSVWYSYKIFDKEGKLIQDKATTSRSPLSGQFSESFYHKDYILTEEDDEYDDDVEAEEGKEIPEQKGKWFKLDLDHDTLNDLQKQHKLKVGHGSIRTELEDFILEFKQLEASNYTYAF